MYSQVQQHGHSPAAMSGWSAPGAGSSGVVSWNSASTSNNRQLQNSVVSRYDSPSFPGNHPQHQQQQYQPYQQQQQQQPSLNAGKVTLYTQYYHGWKTIAESSSSTSTQKEWATYYSDLASRAAHYFHQNPHTTQPPPQDLPPAPPPPPPTAATNNNAAPPPPPAPAVQATQQQQQQQQPKQTGAPNGRSFQVFVDRCLQQCKTPQEKQEIIQSTKTVLQKAMREGNLHSKDWSREPLISLHNPVPTSSASPAVPTSDNYYYGPSAAAAKKSRKKHGVVSSKKTNKSPQANKRSYLESSSASAALGNGSYYGPSTTTSSSLPFSSSAAGTPSKKRSKKQGGTSGFNTSSQTLDKRAQRFADSFQQQSAANHDDDHHHHKGPIIVGKCQVLEKDYLRLTAAPKPELVRPQPVLERHFGNLKTEYANEKYRRDYLWFCSQLKAIRQDCTVQHLKNEFCVQVYEFHATVALEQNDMNEYNQCQTQLKYLYPSLKGLAALPNRAEFLSYRILYAVYLNLHSDKATIDMKDIFGKEQADGHPAVKHALAVLSAAQENNYHAFFARLYPSKFGHQDYFLEKMANVFRKRALEAACSAYRPHLEAEFACQSLQISDLSWLEQVGCVLETIPPAPGAAAAEAAAVGEEQQRVVIKTKESHITDPEEMASKSKLM